MRLGLIGCGEHGSRYLLEKNGGRMFDRVLTRTPRTDLPEWVKGTTDPDEFFAPGLDGVVVATPTETHAYLVIQALAKGLAVLCEKPLCTRWSEAELMIDTAELFRHRLGVAHTDLFHVNWSPPPGVASLVIASFGGQGLADEWAPHAVATAIAAANYWTPIPTETRRGKFCAADHWRMRTMCGSIHALIEPSPERVRAVCARYASGELYRFDGTTPSDPTPIRNMLDVFTSGADDRRFSYDFTRAVYRVLLTESD